jgi:hypothetical protein
MFEDLGGPWQVYRYRPMPSTPAGDLVAFFATKDAADRAVADWNAAEYSLEDVRGLYIAPAPLPTVVSLNDGHSITLSDGRTLYGSDGFTRSPTEPIDTPPPPPAPPRRD